MNRFRSLITRSLITLLIGSGALAMNLNAQSDAITVSVPFPFTVGTQSLAPGTYQFSLSSSRFLLSVTNVKTGDSEMFDVHPDQQRASERRGRLTFRKTEGRSVLNEVHFPGTNLFSELIQPRPDARMETARLSTGKSSCVTLR